MAKFWACTYRLRSGVSYLELYLEAGALETVGHALERAFGLPLRVIKAATESRCVDFCWAMRALAIGSLEPSDGLFDLLVTVRAGNFHRFAVGENRGHKLGHYLTPGTTIKRRLPARRPNAR